MSRNESPGDQPTVDVSRSTSSSSFQSTNWYKAILDSISDIVMVLDRELRHIYINDAGTRMPGMSPDEIIGTRIQDLFPGVEQTPLFSVLQDVLQSGEPRTIIHQLGPGGQKGRWFEDRLYPTNDGILVIGSDITERKQTIDSLSESEERFRTLFEQSLDAIFLVKPDGAAIEANQAWLDLFGYTGEELPHINARDTYEDPAERDSFLERINRDGFVRDEVRLKRKDGTVFDCERHVVALKDSSGDIVSLQGVHRDVTERKRAEQALKESEGRFRALFDHSIDAIFIATADGHILEANQAWLDMFQYTREDLVHLNASDLHPGPAERTKMLAAVAEKGTIRDEARYRRKDGTEFPAQRTVVGLKDETGAVVLYQGIVYDVTELRQAEEREKEQRLLSQALMETSPACVVVFDVHRRIVFANAETDRVLGIPAEQITGGVCGEDILLLSTEGEPLTQDDLPACRVFVTEAPMYSVEYGFDSPTGRRILLVSAAPLYDDEGSVARVVATIEDVTEARRREQHLTEADSATAACSSAPSIW